MKYLPHLWHAVTASFTAFCLWALIKGGLLEMMAITCAFLVIEGYLEYIRE